MSRCYRMVLNIENVAEEKIDPILEAIDQEEDWDHDNPEVTVGYTDIHLEGIVYINNSTSEKDYARSLAQTIWQANACFCPVDVAAFSLDDPPSSWHSFDEEDWQQIKEEERKTAKTSVESPPKLRKE